MGISALGKDEGFLKSKAGYPQQFGLNLISLFFPAHWKLISGWWDDDAGPSRHRFRQRVRHPWRGVRESVASGNLIWHLLINQMIVLPDLVGGLEHVLFSHILGIIIPIDFHIFQRGGSTTNQWCPSRIVFFSVFHWRIRSIAIPAPFIVLEVRLDTACLSRLHLVLGRRFNSIMSPVNGTYKIAVDSTNQYT